MSYLSKGSPADHVSSAVKSPSFDLPLPQKPILPHPLNDSFIFALP